MATPHGKLAQSLKALQDLQKRGFQVYKTNEFTRTDRERLTEAKFLQPIIKGWCMASDPSVRAGDTTPWFSALWEFVIRYATDRFQEKWCLNPEQSLLIHIEDTTIQNNIIISSPAGSNNVLNLPFNTTLSELKGTLLPPSDVETKNGIRVIKLPACLCKISSDFFSRNPVAASVALRGIQDASEILVPLLSGGHSVIAGRLAGAFKAIGKPEIANEICNTMKSAGFEVRENNPFTREVAIQNETSAASPFSQRLEFLWNEFRVIIAEQFPVPAPSNRKIEEILTHVDEVYTTDAYHSLSIEGYIVTTDLIERVKSGNWNPEENEQDKNDKNALAAAGYWQCFQKVQDTIRSILTGTQAGAAVKNTHREWYRALFQPAVTAGLCDATTLAGYRNGRVMIRGSRHTPPRSDLVVGAMGTLFTLLEKEEHPAVRAVLGHWMLGYIHPYSDGNGRMARFLMNTMLVTGGYHWTVVNMTDRDSYMAGLEKASVDGNIVPFTEFLAKRVLGDGPYMPTKSRRGSPWL